MKRFINGYIITIDGRGGENRTPTGGFGDRYNTIMLRPYKS